RRPRRRGPRAGRLLRVGRRRAATAVAGRLVPRVPGKRALPLGDNAGVSQRGQLWGAETTKAVENFPISGETVPLAVVHWLARIKEAAAAVNAELGLLPKRTAGRIEKAAGEIAAGRHDDQFPIDVFQTGSGTSTNMNANEVIARLAGEGVHPNDHVNLGQSSND